MIPRYGTGAILHRGVGVLAVMTSAKDRHEQLVLGLYSVPTFLGSTGMAVRPSCSKQASRVHGTHSFPWKNGHWGRVIMVFTWLRAKPAAWKSASAVAGSTSSLARRVFRAHSTLVVV